MRSIILIWLIIIAGTSIASTTLYRWVDDQGRVHYSDRPQEGADVVTVDSAQTFSAPPVQTTRPAPSEPRPEPAPAYDKVNIASPTQDEVLWNLGGTLTVNVEIQPALQTGHRITVRYNGTAVSDWPPTSTSHTLQDIYRGTHTLDVSIVDANGKVIKSSAPMTFHVKQTSILNRR